MKRLFRIFELSKNEQRVILIVMLILLAVAFIGYEHRIQRRPAALTSAAQPTASPTPSRTIDNFKREQREDEQE
jgi:hypothetical protein